MTTKKIAYRFSAGFTLFILITAVSVIALNFVYTTMYINGTFSGQAPFSSMENLCNSTGLFLQMKNQLGSQAIITGASLDNGAIVTALRISPINVSANGFFVLSAVPFKCSTYLSNRTINITYSFSYKLKYTQSAFVAYNSTLIRPPGTAS